MNKLLIILTITTILIASDADTFNNEIFDRPTYSFSGDHNVFPSSFKLNDQHGMFPSSFKLKGNHALFSTRSKETIVVDKQPDDLAKNRSEK
ncbi:MAG: hypothetical protein RLY40_25 [Pseudomonadota bacterium]|jgi:hypothetical protein